MSFGDAGIYDRSIRGAIGVAKREARRNPPFDDELPAVLRPVVGRTENDHPVGVMISSFGTKDQVVDVEKNRVLTSWNHAPPAVATHHLASQGRRHVLSSASWADGRRRRHVRGVARGSDAGRTHVGLVIPPAERLDGRRRNATQVLRVTACHLDDLGAHFDRFTESLLPTSPARVANGKRDLVRRAACVGRSGENVTRYEKQCRVLVKGSPNLSTNLPHGFSKSRERLCRDLESEDVHARGCVGPITWPIAELVPRHQLFDLADRSAFCDSEPIVLVLGYGDARELASGRPADSAIP